MIGTMDLPAEQLRNFIIYCDVYVEGCGGVSEWLMMRASNCGYAVTKLSSCHSYHIQDIIILHYFEL